MAITASFLEEQWLSIKKGDYIWRKSKGETSGILVLGMRSHFENICQLILEGRFAAEGLVDREILLAKLNGFRHGSTETLWPLVNLMAVNPG